MSTDNLLIVADSEHDANMLYAVGMFVPDPFIYLRIKGRGYVVLSDLEVDRAKQRAPHCRLIRLSRCQVRLRAAGVAQPKLSDVIHLVAREKRLRRFCVPENFPLGIARELETRKLRVVVRPGEFFPERAIKSPEEVKKISAALMMAEVGLAEGIQALKHAKVGKNRRLIYHDLPLTSEKLRAIINTAIIQAGGIAAHTIVAGGRQGCDPHEEGHGPLRANEPIILDVFPRSQKTGYFGDITRTVVKGRASEAVRKLYDTVRRAQELATRQVRDRAPARRVHEAVQAFFEQEGYKTGKVQGRMQGFFHGTGHGLGLEIHEAPRMGAHSTDVLRIGHVVTVEPGLYYPELGGGVRLEDVVRVMNNHPRNLTRFEKVLEV